MRTVIPKNANFVPAAAKRVFTGVIYDVYHWQQSFPDGTEATFEMLKRPDTVEVIAIKDNKIYAVYDEQIGRPPEFKLPGGRHDVPSETELDCGKRELHEEIGMRFKTWKLINAEQVHFKIEQVLYTYIATDFEGQDEPHVDVSEKITLRPIDFSEAKRIAETDEHAFWPNRLFRQVDSLESLIALPEYK